MSKLLVCTGSKVLLPDTLTPVPATIVIDQNTGKIIEIRKTHLNRDQYSNESASIKWIEAGNYVVLPGLVDAHVHLNEPGRTDWEGFWTGTRAAASGGITALVDMPLNSLPPTTTVPNLQEKRDAARGQCHTDVAFWGGVIPGNQEHLKPLIQAGVRGFKCFLIESGVDEFPFVTEAELENAMKELDEISGVLLFHAELDDDFDRLDKPDPTEYATFLASRPQQLETKAISLVIKLQKRFPNVRCHIVHLSAASALPSIKEAQAAGLPLTVETCFHYLTLAAEEIPDGHPEFKCCPPVRETSNRDKLWEALREGVINCVVSDHSPCIAKLKHLDDGDIMKAWGGISTLGFGLSLLWTEGKKRGFSIGEVVDLTSKNAAEHAGLSTQKGQLKIGFDGDFVLWDEEAVYEITKDVLQYKNKISPYEGKRLSGRVEETYLRGNRIYSRSAGFESPMGKLL
ncbi:hypothetical protein CPB83DRAFT_848537 [Crepidotus variabilis]|uniref:allantoinase n=1 Tax=Crepidotus variabilis TaxID=179855 RepID=A0A9P6JTK9_9AGAR|nr:hypothetical protein CPB83DRAFT_848537 [Crepidotus variabilis]